MATRFYLPSSGAAAVSPAFHADWENTDDATRIKCVTTKSSTAMTTTAYRDNSNQNQDHLIHQWVSDPIEAQTVQAQTVKIQVRGLEGAAGDNQFLTWGVRVVSGDGTTETGVCVAVRRDGTEWTTGTLTNRGDSITSGSVSANAGDRIVIEIGTGGDPTGGGNHDCDLRIGDVAASDLAENDTSTTDNNPWVEFGTDTITFVIAISGASSDGVDLGDSTAAALGTLRASSDGVDLGESLAGTIIDFAFQADGVVLGDSAAGDIIVVYSEAASDGVKLSDTTSLLQTHGAPASDGIKAGDSTVPLRTQTETTSDGVKLGDATEYIYIPGIVSGASTDGADLGDSTVPTRTVDVPDFQASVTGGWTNGNATSTWVSDTPPTGINQPVYELEDTDSSGAGQQYKGLATPIAAADGAVYRSSGWVKKTTSRTYGVYIHIDIRGGDSNTFDNILLNTDDGTFINSQPAGHIRRGVESWDANWWYCWADRVQVGTSTQIDTAIYPAYILESGSLDATLLGTQRVCGWRSYHVEGVSLGDTAAHTFIARNVVTDGAKLGDVAAAIGTWQNSALDGTKLGDSVSALIAKLAASSDGVDLGDSTAYLYRLGGVTSDGTKLGDIAAAIGTWQNATSDGTDLGDTADADLTVRPTVSDGVDLGDTTAPALIYVEASSDGVDLGDTATALQTVGVTATDGAQFGDSCSAVHKKFGTCIIRSAFV